MATNSVLAKLAVVISANTAQFSRELTATRKDLNSFTSGITKLTGALGIAFSVQQVASFALEVSKLSGEAEGVSAAFERLPNSTKLMNDLKAATGNTVSELSLMKRAVQASNFDISLQALPRLLEFATLRAQQTGQSVDYLVDSIVTGIGRKSKLILDNLGISAVQLDEALGGASTAASSIGEVADAVGRIAEENLKNMAGFSDNASTKLQKLAASWENVKVSIGDASNSTGILGGVVDELTASLNVLASKNLSFLEKLVAFGGFGTGIDLATQLDQIRNQQKVNAEQKKQEQIIREVDRAFKEFNGDIDAYGRAIETHIYRTELLAEFTKRLTKQQEDQVVTLEDLRTQLGELNTMYAQTDVSDQKRLLNIAAQIDAINKQIEAIENLKNVQRLSATSSRALSDSSSIQIGEKTGSDFLSETQIDATIGKLGELKIANTETTTQIESEWTDLSGVVSGALSGLGQALGSAISGSANLGEALLGVLGGVLVQLGEMLITAGIGVEAFKASLESLNGAVAIAAGVALVALGSAISGSIKGLGAGGSGSARAIPGNFNSAGFTGSNSIQDTKPKLITVLKGQDIWIALENYRVGNGFTKA